MFNQFQKVCKNWELLGIYLVAILSIFTMDSRYRSFLNISIIIQLFILIYPNKKNQEKYKIAEKIARKYRTLTIFIIIFYLSMLTSLIFNFSFKYFLVVISNVSLGMWLFFMSISVYIKYNSFIGATISMLLSHTTITIYSIVFKNYDPNRFYGIFRNYNTMAILISLEILMMLFLIINYIKLGDNFSRIVVTCSIIYVFIIFVFMLKTHSRTALFTVLILSIYGILNSFKKVEDKKILLLSLTIFIVFLLALYLFNHTFNHLINSNISKIFTKVSEDNLDGRTSIWKIIIQESKIFGNGVYYFENHFLKESQVFEPHNTFFSYLAIYGWVTASAYLLTVLAVFFYLFFYSKQNSSSVESFSKYLIMYYCLYSIPENMYFRPISIFVVLCIVYLFSTKVENSNSRRIANV